MILESLLFQRDGRLTRELLLQPGKFGLGKLPAGVVADATTVATCGFCSVGCGLNIHLQNGQAVGLTPAADHPVNLGMACPKGWEALNVLKSPDRATTPLVRRNGELAPVSWDEALTTFVDRFRSIQQQHGPDSLAFLSTGQMATEEMALLGSLAKFGMGIRHGDGNTRQCMATAVVAYKESLGFDAPPYTYKDLEESDVIVLIGANVCIAHPILWERIRKNPYQPHLIVVDPRRTETAMSAQTHLAVNPKADLDLFYGLANLLVEMGAVDWEFVHANTNGAEQFIQFVEKYTPEAVAEATGISVEALRQAAKTIAEGKRVSFWWTMGVNQSHQGVRTAQAIINLALLGGRFGKPGSGANSITGQCNAMGSRLYSNTTNLLGGRDYADPQHRAEVASVLGIDAARIPDRNCWAYDQIIDGVRKGVIKGLWVVATNPAHSWIDQADLHECFNKLEFLVVQDMYTTTETAERADLLLPAAAWGEKDGTFINSERRIGLLKNVSHAPGAALADFAIFKLVANYWGCGGMFEEWETPEAAFQVLKRLSNGRPCDISGISDYRMLDEENGVQWPLAEGAELTSGERRLFADGKFFHEDGKAKFIFSEPRPLPEPTDDEYPFLLLTGRGSAAQWHTQTRTGKSAVLRKLAPTGVHVEMHPDDAASIGAEPNTSVRVASRRGEVIARTLISATVKPGQVFIPMHEANINQLTLAEFDPYSRQPAYKACAVSIRPLD